MNKLDKSAISTPRQRLRVGFILLDAFTLNAFSGFIEAVRLSADVGGRSRQIDCGWEIMGPSSVTASCGLITHPSSGLIDPSRFDYIAVCGGNGYLNRTQPKWFDKYLHEADAAGVPLIGLCTGTFNIARAGLMAGYVACVHWNVFEAFRAEFPTIDALPDRIFLDAGKRITCAGSAGASDLALHLISRHCGHDKAQQSIRHMMLPDIRPASYPQAHFYNDLNGVRDDRVRRAVHLMEQTLNGPMPMPELAQHSGTGLRQLERCFTQELGQTPTAYYRNMRLRYGAWLLTHTRLSISQIAGDAGFADAPHFSREFKALFRKTPRAHRQEGTDISFPAPDAVLPN
ncbi:MAG: GlxA family transcriptional regulator [Rhodospirillales bacterium]|nr:GlxA family transcriptional regulator [Rhodospirillales bacterium]